MLFALQEIDKKSPNIAVSKTIDSIHIRNKMSNTSQEPPVSSRGPNEDLKDIFLRFGGSCPAQSTFIVKIMYEVL